MQIAFLKSILLRAFLTYLRDFDLGLVRGGFTSWGDFVFQNGELFFITNHRLFVIDTKTGAQTLKGFHFTDFITSETFIDRILSVFNMSD